MGVHKIVIKYLSPLCGWPPQIINEYEIRKIIDYIKQLILKCENVNQKLDVYKLLILFKHAWKKIIAAEIHLH